MLPVNPGIYAFCRFGRLIVYVGSAKSLSRRYATHMSYLRKRNHPNQHLQHVYNCYGEGSLQFVILEDVEDMQNLLTREQHYMDTLEPPYNIVKKAGSRLGTLHTEESKRKMSQKAMGNTSHKGIEHTSEAKERIAAKKRGLKPNENQLRGLAMARVPGIKRPNKKKREPRSESHLANLRKAWVVRKANGKDKVWNKGVPMDSATRSKLIETKRRNREAKIAAELAKSPLQSSAPIEPIDSSTLILRSLWDWAEEQDA